MRRTEIEARPVGRLSTAACSIEMGPYGVGDRLTFHTGEEVMVTALCSVTYKLKSLNGRGTFLLTPEELRELLG